MPATNKTANYGLPIYVANDHFSVLGDLNSAMSTIDAQLGEASTQASSAATDSSNALTAANNAQQAANDAKQSATNTLTTAANAQAAAKAASDDVKTLTGRVESAESAASGASSTAASASSAAQSASQTAASANAAAQNAVTVAGGVDSKAQTALDTANTVSGNYSAIMSRLKYFNSFGGSTIATTDVQGGDSATYYNVKATGLTPGMAYTVEGNIRASKVNDNVSVEIATGPTSTRMNGFGSSNVVSFQFAHTFLATSSSQAITVTMNAGSDSQFTTDSSYSRLIVH